MSDIIFEVIKIAVMVAALVIATKIVPYIKANVSERKLDSFRAWVMDAVTYAQQILWSEDGATRKRVVLKACKELRDIYKLDITDSQLEILIEAAVLTLHNSLEGGDAVK